MTKNSGLRIYREAVAVVTGGASGIGRALGLALARRGATVVLADLQIDLAEQVACTIRQSGGDVEAVHLDVTDFDAVKSLVDDTMSKRKRLDFMFNNAGIAIIGEVWRYQLADWTRVLDVNVRGVVHGVQAAYPMMIQQGFGHIVNVASISGLTPSSLDVGYCASKHAVVGLSTSLRIEAATQGVRVSVLCPGAVDTPILRDGGKYGKQLTDAPAEFKDRIRELLRPIDPDVFARKALKAIAKNKAIVVIPPRWKWSWWLDRLSPSLGLFVRGKIYDRIKPPVSIVEGESQNVR